MAVIGVADGNEIQYERYRAFINREMTDEQERSLEAICTFGAWQRLLAARREQDAMTVKIKEAQSRKDLITECLAPLAPHEGAAEVGMRQMRLLAAILEKLP